MTAAPASPSLSGTNPIVISGSATCTTANPLFQFWYLGQGSSTWQLAQAYSTKATYNWNSTGALAGAHKWSVWVHDANDSGTFSNSLGSYDNFGNLSPDYQINAPSCASVSVAPGSAQTAGTPITVTATAGTCSNPNPVFQFWYLGKGASTWQMVKDYSTTNTFAWNSTGALTGNHIFSVWIKDAKSPGLNSAFGSTYDAFSSPNATYAITQPSCASVSIMAVPTSVTGGVHSIITATAGTCSNPNPVFQFWYLAKGSSTWQMVQDYSTKNTFDWNSAGAVVGNHVFSVWIKDAKSAGANSALGSTYDAFSSPNATVAVT